MATKTITYYNRIINESLVRLPYNPDHVVTDA